MALLQSAGTKTDSDTANVGITVNFGGNTTAGSTLVVAAFVGSFSGLTISDTSGDKFTTRLNNVWLGSGSNGVYVWTASNIAGGNVGGINVQESTGTVNLSVIAFEYSNQALDLVVDKTQQAGDSGTSVPTTGNTAAQTFYPTETVIAVSAAKTATTQTVGSGYGNFSLQVASASYLAMEDKSITTRQVVSGDFGTSTSNWTAFVMTMPTGNHILYKPASASNKGLRPHPFSPGIAR